MAKTKVSEWDIVADNNQDISGITLGTGMPPSYVNDSIREMMAQIKDWQSGSSGDDYTISGNLGINGTLTINSQSGNAGQVLVSQGNNESPTWGDAFVRGMIMLWSGSTNNIPIGWALCNGSNGTPDLRDRFVVGAGSTYAVNAKGGSKDAVVVSHSHTGSVTINTKTGLDGTLQFLNRTNNAQDISIVTKSSGSVTYNKNGPSYGLGYDGGAGSKSTTASFKLNHNHSGSVKVNSAGSSGNNANLPPYYALAYIMKV